MQPHGILLALDEPGLTIAQASENAVRLLGTSSPLTDLGLDEVMSPESFTLLKHILNFADPRPLAPLRLMIGGRLFDGIAHRHNGRLILELEPAIPSGDDFDPDRLVKFTLTNLRNDLRLREFCGIVAREVRTLTGFDRVMIYRFDPDWNGEVVAEEKRDDLEPFLGLHYPASDIPAQARRLYHLNLVRHIPDLTYASSPLIPEMDPRTGQSLDLSHAVLRSVSPIHVEYLQNMGVGASLTISLMKDGRLWGLAACHHYAIKFLPYRVRAGCETLSILVSLQLSAKLDAEDLRNCVEAQNCLGRLTNKMAGSAEPEEALGGQLDDLTGLTRSEGAAVVLGKRVILAGQTPEVEQIRGMIRWLQAGGQDDHAVHHLSAEFPDAGQTSGLLAVRFGEDEFLLWFRPEKAAAVYWAGNPHYKRVVTGPNGSRLSPRGSFAAWKESQLGRSEPWGECEREAARGLRDAVRAVQARRTAGMQAEALRRDDFLAAVAHELRNPLSPIRNATNLIRLSSARPEMIAPATDMIDRQVGHLTRIVDDLWDASRAGRGKLQVLLERINLTEVVRDAAEDARSGMETAGLILEIQVPSEPVWVLGDAVRLAQVAGNLLTNARKFTDRGGRVAVDLSTGEGVATLTVADTGVGIPAAELPKVFVAFAQVEETVERSREGLGLGLALVKAFAELHGGGVRVESAGVGLGATFRVNIPLDPSP